MAAHDLPDGVIDRMLTSVPGGSTRSAATLEALFDDAAVDRLLRRVRSPVGLIGRVLGSDPTQGTVDLDAVVFDGRIRPLLPGGGADGRSGGPRPWAGFGHSARRLVRLAARGAVDGVAVAAVLVAAVAVFAGGSLASKWLSESHRPSRTTAVAVRPAARSISAPAAVSATAAEIPAMSLAKSTPRSAVDEPAEDARGELPRSSMVETESVKIAARDDAANGGSGDDSEGPVRGAPATGVGRGVGLGSMRVVAMPRRARRGVPQERGYDLAFELTHGIAPFIDPSGAKPLAVDAPPLSVGTDSFDAFELPASPGPQDRQTLAKSLRQLQVEDVLAALPAEPAAAEPRLRMIGYPAFRKQARSRLLEIRATAPAPSRVVDRAIDPGSDDVIVVMDASASPGAATAWQAMVRGLRDAAGALGGRGTISVVLFTNRVVVAAERADASIVARLCDGLAAVRPGGAGDLHQALAEVRRSFGDVHGEPGRRRCVILAHAGSLDRAERHGDELLAAWRAAGAGGAEPGGLSVIRIDPAAGSSMETFGVGDGGSLIDGVRLDAGTIRRRVAGAIVGSSTVSAADCRLEVAFDPATVAAYRLVGHRRQVVDLAVKPSGPPEMCGGETVRVVYELLLKEKQGSVARASFWYVPPEGGRERRIESTIAAAELAIDPAAGDASAWAPWLAVGLTEFASGSPHVESSAGILERLRSSIDRWSDGAAGDAATRRLLAIARAAVGLDAGTTQGGVFPAAVSIERFDAKK